jgi:hypothetical protein
MNVVPRVIGPHVPRKNLADKTFFNRYRLTDIGFGSQALWAERVRD